jgi:AAA15 family ATPase/GTPase
MLIRFAVENHLSIRDKQELSLVAANLQDSGADLITTKDFRLLPAALLYGANASGKSNFISALNFLMNSVLFSHERGGPATKLPRNPFVLDKTSTKLPTKIDVDFLLNGVRFHYGFSATDEAFIEEWLYAFPSAKKQIWFYRDARQKNIHFGKSLKGAVKTIETLTRPNSLFLSAAAQNAHKQLTPVYNYLSNFSIKDQIENRGAHAFAAFREGKIDSRIIEFLQRADTGISSYQFSDNKMSKSGIDQQSFVKDLLGILNKCAPDDRKPSPDVGDIEFKEISLGHQAAAEIQFFDIRRESAGTLRLLVLLKPIFEALDTGSLVVIDELDASLHTYLAEQIVALFNSKKTNPKGAQLIATTHDTNLLCADYLRRDQVWFVEKDRDGASTLYPLTDIRTRGADNLEKGYLQGRFGAVPFRGPIDRLGGSQ